MQAIVQTGRSKIKKLPVRAKDDKPKFLEKSNFEKRDYQTQRMLNLREQGYTNGQIAKMVGCCPATVLNRIGRQPEAITKNSKDLASEAARASARRREAYRANQVMTTYNQLMINLNIAEKKAFELRVQAMELLPSVVDASKLSGIEPIRLL